MTRRAPIIGVLVALLLAVAFYFLLWSPRNDDLAVIRDETAQLETQRTSLRNELVRLREIEQNQVQFRAALAQLEEYIPSGPAQATVIRQFQLAADAAGVAITVVSFGDPAVIEQAPPTGEPETALATISVNMTIEGGYFQVVDFFRRLEIDVPRALLVDQFTMIEGEDEFPSLATTWVGQVFAIVPTPTTVAGAPAPDAPAPAEGAEATEGEDAPVEVEQAQEADQ